jgi:hypothetical protein
MLIYKEKQDMFLISRNEDQRAPPRGPLVSFSVLYTPMQEVAPSAVRIADAMDAISCTINLTVSFLLILI